ncbi:MAG: hypothetical protein ACU85U_06565 [Gammaproteobacteria bacterium]
MKLKLTVCALIALLFAAGSAEARGNGHHGYRHGGNHFSQGYHRGGYGYSGHGHYAQSLVGGLLLGALLAPPRTVVVPPPVVYVPQPAPVVVATPPPVAVASGRRLLRDINGNCFERQIDAAGREVHLSLPPSECAW